MLDRLPYVGGLREQLRNAGAFPAGHFYSPIPASAEVSARVQSLEKPGEDLPGINLNTNGQSELLQAFQAYYPDLPFPEEKLRTAATTFGKVCSAMPTPSSSTVFSDTLSHDESSKWDPDFRRQ